MLMTWAWPALAASTVWSVQASAITRMCTGLSPLRCARCHRPQRAGARSLRLPWPEPRWRKRSGHHEQPRPASRGCRETDHPASSHCESRPVTSSSLRTWGRTERRTGFLPEARSRLIWIIMAVVPRMPETGLSGHLRKVYPSSASAPADSSTRRWPTPEGG
jgi:hypothetical protein